ncbi:MAG: transporter substrate-binding domain-containing protein [Myxococcota bacterium]
MLRLLSLSFLLVLGCSKKRDDANLVLCTNSTYPPYESIDAQGNSVGFDIDVAGAIATQLGKKLVIKEMAFDSLILGLSQDKCDLAMAGLSITPSRQKEITLIPYQGEPSKSYYLLFWEQIPAGIQTAADIQNIGNKTVAVQVGTWMEDFVKTIPGIEIKALDATTELIMEIKHKKSAASFVEPHIGKDVVQKESRIKFIEVALAPEDWKLGNGIGIKKSNAKLAAKIELALSQLKKAGTLETLEKKWFSKK